jgi:hypothetical protein
MIVTSHFLLVFLRLIWGGALLVAPLIGTHHLNRSIH